jgi:hypothetical protein
MVKRITLVKFKDELFPRSEADFQALKAAQVTVFRIPENLLDYLKETLLRKHTIHIVDFPSVYKEGMLKFKSAVLDKNNIRSKFDKNVTLLGFDRSDIELLNNACVRLTNQMGRFGLKVLRENKPDHRDPENKMVCRLEVVPDPEINPSYYFGDFISEFNESAVVHLSKSARLSFKSRPSRLNPGKTTFCLEFQDLFGEEWQSAFSRAFDLHSLDRAEVAVLINQLMKLSNSAEHYVAPVTPKTLSR